MDFHLALVTFFEREILGFTLGISKKCLHTNGELNNHKVLSPYALLLPVHYKLLGVRLIVHSVVCPFIHYSHNDIILSLTRSFVHSFIHSFIYPLIRPSVPSFLPSLLPSILACLLPSLFPSPSPPSFVHLFVRLFIHSFIHSFIHLFVGVFLCSFTGKD